MRLTMLTVAVLAVVTLAPDAAHAGGLKKWTSFTSKKLSQDDEVGLIRRAGSSRLVVASVEPKGGKDALVVSTFDASGDLRNIRRVTSGWTDMGDPDIVRAPGTGLRIFFTGLKDGSEGLHSAFSPTADAKFVVEPAVVALGDGVNRADIGAGSTKDGQPLQSWAGSLGVRVHAGLTPSVNAEFQSLVVNNCCGNGPDVVTDGRFGTTFVGWHSDTSPKQGVYVTKLDPATGQPAGNPLLMPGTADVDRQASRTPITGLPSAGGIFTAYPTGSGAFPTQVRVWGVGRPKSTVLGRLGDDVSLRSVGITSDPKNRLWVFWQAGSLTRSAVYARRSKVTKQANGITSHRFGKAKKIALPKGFRLADQLFGDARSGRLDLVGLFRKDGKPGGYWHRQIRG